MTAPTSSFGAINGNGAVHPAHLDGSFALKVSHSQHRQTV